jgi:uncharacterized protein YndB with AHSA1/START domain
VSTFRTSRAFAAPPETVFAAFEQPERLAKWWGPNGFHNTFDLFDFKPGGLWRFTMHGPNGSNFPNEATFVAIEPARKIVIKHLSKPHFQLTIELESNASGTLVTWEQAFESPEVAASLKHIVEPANEQNLSRWQGAVANGGSGLA